MMNKQEGFAVLDILFAIVIFAIIMPTVASMTKVNTDMTRAKVAAGQMTLVGEASIRYIKGNYAALVASSTAANATVVPYATLDASGLLPSTANNPNTYGQSYTLYVLEPNPNELLGVLLTSGGMGYVAGQEDFADIQIPNSAKMIGSDGGFIPTGNVPGQPSTSIIGADGGWDMPFAGTDIPNPGPGHLAMMIYVDNDQLVTDFLARTTIPGRPEMNQMLTDLDLSSNDITNVGTLTTDNLVVNTDIQSPSITDTTKGKTLSQAVQDVVVVSNGGTLAKPTCPATETAEVFISPVMYSNDAVGDPIGSVQTWAVDNGSDWTGHLRILTPSGWVSPSAAYGKIMMMSKCS
jgi:type II secretory pathway pseudopilin PulG